MTNTPSAAEREPSTGQTIGPLPLERGKATVLVSVRLDDELVKSLEGLAEIDSADPKATIYPVTVADELRGAVQYGVDLARETNPEFRRVLEAARANERH